MNVSQIQLLSIICPLYLLCLYRMLQSLAVSQYVTSCLMLYSGVNLYMTLESGNSYFAPGGV